MKVIILHQTIAKHDAIGNDIFHMYNFFKEKGYECWIYCNYLLNDKMELIDIRGLNNLIKDRNNLLIYHHSVFWKEGEKILENACCKIAIRYHNITPEKYFKRYFKHAFNQCKNGIAQTKRLSERFPDALWICASNFNLLDLEQAEKKAVVPPFNNIEIWDKVKPEESILKFLIENKKINLLFVGRVAPNKGHKILLDVVKCYINNYDDKVMLYIIGKKDDNLNLYNKELKLLIQQYDIENNIKFIGEITDSALISYYLGCDFFICCSEHEGFCVPLLEAQYLHLPLIVKGITAVSETIGYNQIILEDDVKAYVSAIKILSQNECYKQFIISSGYNNYISRFTNCSIKESFNRILSEYIGKQI